MKVWDLATRLYHWTQAIVFIGLLVTGFSGNGPHLQLGLVLFTLITWRISWGIVGSETSLFRQFMASPRKVWAYLKTGRYPQLGHNPLGSWMVFTLLASLLIQCVTGMILAGMFDGLVTVGIELPDIVYAGAEQIHLLLVDLLPLLIVVHVGAVLIYKLRAKPLLWAMLSGYQQFAANHLISQPNIVSSRRALVVLIASSLVTMAIVAISMV
ncbi:cytochrome b/b6 domain-containing protein [Vibrio methylphosphonaticus]|uniref:cytochrome b/b6 domain-containing protein n=1 Tax=Vibrio methylphosphonaticus TaxID=2946866 RepID=UPI00202A409C|nr:cytochrome b/b6 domain-containing protein [Vibrio methylphosphonaticus]MCL9776856.1 cytochrome b/b6 domain-containing protein [Vibrio methylphosphonaticus]